MRDQSLAARAAWLSHIGGYTQGEIAKRLDVSAAKAHRLIVRAHKEGMVRVFIDGVPEECLELEEAIGKHFALDSCVVAPVLGPVLGDDEPDHHADFAAVGAAAARSLHNLLASSVPAMIGVGKGRSLAAMVKSMPKYDRPDLKFVSVSGSLTRNLSANPFDIIHNLVERTRGEGYFLPVPYIASSVEEKELLLAQKSVKDMLHLARQSDLFIIGVGAIAEDAHVRQVSLVTREEWQDLIAHKAVGDIMGSFIDEHGVPVKSAVNQHALGLGLEDLRGRKVIAVVGGPGKSKAVLAALRTGVITDLIVGEDSARTVRDLM